MIHNLEPDHFCDQFRPDELHLINHADDKMNAFFRLWTIKEAVIKAEVMGLSLDLKKIFIDHGRTIVDERVWHVHEIPVANNYFASLASESRVGNIKLEEVIIPGH